MAEDTRALTPSSFDRRARSESSGAGRRRTTGALGTCYRGAIVALAMVLVGFQPPDVATSDEQPRGRPLVIEARLEKEAITPGSVRYLQRAIQQAGDANAECIIIVLDTPGGLLDSTEKLVDSILESRVPVVVYVPPPDAQAASAGGFITLAAHVAAMAPHARIGAMTPVSLGGLPISPPQGPETPAKPSEQESEKDEAATSKPLERKIINDSVAWARSLAEMHGRNADWAAQAVRDAIVVTGTEALEQGVIDLVADDFEDLLEQLNGREVTLGKRSVTLHTEGARVRLVEMWWGERLLTIISTPNVAFLLMMFGFYGILFEMYSPGWGVAGTLGVICLVLAFFGLAVLPVNFLGLALIAVALAMFAAEVFVTSFGALALGGAICLVLGAVMLIDSPIGFMRISLSVIIPITLATVLIVLWLLGSVVRAQHGPIQTGGETLVGMQTIAVDAFDEQEDNYAGTVRIHGEFWNALSPVPIAGGQYLRIEGREGLTLFVQPTDPTSGAASTSSAPER